MTSNLNVKLDTACWAYGETEHIPYEYNVSKYGRLYTWDAANALAKKIQIKLYSYDKNNPTQKKSPVRQYVQARLLSQQDILDILESENLGYNEYTIDDNDSFGDDGFFGMGFHYYDVFLGGIDGPSEDDNEPDYSRGEKSLGGFRNSDVNSYYLNNWYCGLNELGLFWLNNTGYPESGYSPFHRIFNVEYNNEYNYVANINVGFLNQHGMSVRYVFEPKYK